MSKKGFHHISYERHTSCFNEHSLGGKLAAHAKTWLENDTLDAFRHQRMYAMLDPLIETYPKARWLTVGDGRFGGDAKYILDKGCEAMATDISDTLLKEAKESGHITDYRKENAEALSFGDEEFDFVFCKESYHHFPRPMIALYEMLRVASKGVVLIEPNDVVITDSFTKILYKKVTGIIKCLLLRQRDESSYGFEKVGNFIFSLSRREVEKAALGLNLHTVAFHGINELLSENNASYKKFKRKILIHNIKERLGLVGNDLLVAVIFKVQPSEDVIRNLVKQGYTIVNLPKNPFI
jgi:ubiquinone/menaquinone biosynthesis C-methylase UbiE